MRTSTIEQAMNGLVDDTCFDADKQKKEYEKAMKEMDCYITQAHLKSCPNCKNYLEDFYTPELVSNCCRAEMRAIPNSDPAEGVCPQCKEHCMAVETE